VESDQEAVRFLIFERALLFLQIESYVLRPLLAALFTRNPDQFTRLNVILSLMRRVSLSMIVLMMCLAGSVAAQQPAAVNDDVLKPVVNKSNLYPADADAKKEIENALKIGAGENKRVLLIFGANWCYDCHVLDRALHEGIAGKVVSESFILVHVDIGEGEKNPDLIKTYRIPLNKGVPALAVLDGDGKMLFSSGEGEFESARTMLKKDLVAFLRRWKLR
jgi:thioredoxin 1